MRIVDRRFPLLRTTRGALAVVLGLALLLVVLHPFDGPTAVALRGLPNGIRTVMSGITRFGMVEWILLPSLLMIVLCWLLAIIMPPLLLRRAAIELAGLWGFVFVGVGLPSLVTTLLKSLVGRARPTLLDQLGSLAFHPNWSTYDYRSFPSGHATTAFALAVVVGVLVPKLRWPMLAYAVVVAFSRMALGQHYLTDVTAGAIVGTLGGYAVRDVFADRRWALLWTTAGSDVRPRTAALRRVLRRSRRQPSAAR